MSSVAHLSSSWVILSDGVWRSDQQRAAVSTHSQTLRGAWTAQLRAPQTLEQLQVPHFTSGRTETTQSQSVDPEAEEHLKP